MIKFLIIAAILLVIIIYTYYWQGMDLTDIYRHTPICLGHRGDRLNYPENTLASYRSAIDKGLYGVELDVMLTKDGKLVCSHNFDLERETNGIGFIDEMEYIDLAQIKTGRKFPKTKQQQIPLLTEVVKNLPEATLLNIEIKTKSAFDLKAAVKVAKMIKNGDIPQKVIVSSFNPIAVRTIKFVSKSIPTGFIYSKEKNFRGVFIAQPDCLHPRAEIITDKVIRFCNKRNMRINTWTVNSTHLRDWIIKKGINGIITDHPELSTKN